jgi:hypothetical protein
MSDSFSTPPPTYIWYCERDPVLVLAEVGDVVHGTSTRALTTLQILLGSESTALVKASKNAR